MQELFLFNTLSRKKEEFNPIHPARVGMYVCGPTVYNYAHIGNLRSYIFEDILRRILAYNKYQVKQVMNVTDVGHLTSDANTGDDKVEMEAKKEGKSAWEIAAFYTQKFKEDLARLNVQPPTLLVKATEHIKEQIELIKILEKKGYTYLTDDGIYFDTSRFPNYTKLAKLDLEGLIGGARVELNPQKKHPADFVLWKLSPKKVKRQMEWESPWGVGFPGWHIECSAMSMRYLGETFDIHTGGVDHIPVHHTNEIAQSEAATGKKFVNYWLHGEFLVLGQDEKMAKSYGNFITLQTLVDKGFNPLAYRYLCLTAHYRSKLNFSWESVQAAQNALNNLYQMVGTFEEPRVGCAEYEQRFLEAVNDDLDMPKALVIVWELVKSDQPSSAKMASLKKFDQVLGLDLQKARAERLELPPGAQELLSAREKARKAKDWAKSDQLREKLLTMGVEVEDGPIGTRWKIMG
ncbi:MAG: cysteine--tRNA ligase [Patescibacteria group bacterium]|nr:cysteine--tRNA ligase [Patescibacteria group bacterium]